MNRTVRTAAVSAALAGSAALVVAGPALAGAVRSAGPLTSYDATRAPAGATAQVHSVETGDGRTIVTLHVSGLQPFAQYGAHAHVNACGVSGAAAGPHFQFVKDPVSPSVDPAYANPENEIWLDLTANAAGEGHAKAVLDRQFRSDRRPGSVILHERHTATGTGQAGTAGTRVACLTVAF